MTKNPLILIVLTLLTTQALAQTETQLTDDGTWQTTTTAPLNPDAQIMADAQKYIAQGNPGKAVSKLSNWLEKNKRSRSNHIAQAYYLRGLAHLENDREYKALFDFELVIRDFSDSEYYAKAVQREYDIAKLYLAGLKRRFLGVRFESGRPIAEELLIRTQERLPGSQIAETAALDLANHYYNQRQLKLAAEMYEIFRINHPDSRNIRYAMLREIECNIARFKGPRYDGSGLLDAKLLIEQYTRKYPGESIRSGITQGLDAWIDESAAQQALDTAKWYLKTNDLPSAKFILARLLRRHPATIAADQAIDLMLKHDWLSFQNDSQQTSNDSE
ncbi:MAG: outer membrane protein assembly factor BamD [Phycisphaerales bacterium]|nr:outer membrane protein assembly factor BamD [Phycisphaerales bacterium]